MRPTQRGTDVNWLGFGFGVLLTPVLGVLSVVVHFWIGSAAGGTIGLFGEPTIAPSAWWYPPAVLCGYLAAFMVAVATFERAAGLTRWMAVLAVPTAAGGWLLLTFVVWGT
jgi:hypothetical protein